MKVGSGCQGPTYLVMKYPFLLVLLLTIAACSTPPASSPNTLRPDVIYFQNGPAGEAAAKEIRTLFDGRQETALIDHPVPLSTFPVPTYRTLPLYPFELRQQNLEGTVTVEFIIGENGKVLEAVAVATTNPGFNAQAVIAVRQWTFKPATRDGLNVRSFLRVPIIFTLAPNK